MTQVVREKMLGVWRRSALRTRVVVGVVVLALVGATVWWFGRGRADDGAPDGPTTRTATASLGTIEKAVTTTGTLTPLVQEDVSFEVPGTVTSVQVSVGDTVAAGQTLATVDTLRLDAERLSALADLAEARADLAAAEEDDDGSDVARARITALTAQVEVARAAADEAEADLAGATLVAPVAGLVTTVDLEVGDVVGSGSSSGATGSVGAAGSGAMAGGFAGASTATADGTAAFTIVGTDAWRVDASVGESDVALVEVGDQVEMTSDDLDGTLFGTVSTIGKVSSSTSGTAAYPVTVAVTGTADGLHDGIEVDVEIVYERRTDVLTVPSAAVATGDDGATTVTVVGADGEQVVTAVETGGTSGDLTEITSGLTEGDEVVVQVFTAGGGGQQAVPGGGQVPEGFPGGGFPEGFPEDFDPSQFGGPGGMPGGGQVPGGRNG